MPCWCILWEQNNEVDIRLRGASKRRQGLAFSAHSISKARSRMRAAFHVL